MRAAGLQVRMLSHGLIPVLLGPGTQNGCGTMFKALAWNCIGGGEKEGGHGLVGAPFEAAKTVVIP